MQKVEERDGAASCGCVKHCVVVQAIFCKVFYIRDMVLLKRPQQYSIQQIGYWSAHNPRIICEVQLQDVEVRLQRDKNGRVHFFSDTVNSER